MPPRKHPWFRLYVEMIWDRKIRRLDVIHRWLWVVSLACARSSPQPGILLLTEGDAMGIDDLADAAAIKPKHVREGLQALQGLNLLDLDEDGTWFVPRWSERQFESDDVTLRTAKHRSMERSNDVPENDSGTHQIQRQRTETETDTERTPPTPPKGGLRSAGESPRQKAAARERDAILDRLNDCGECGDNPNVWCDRCTSLRRKLAEVT